MKVQRFLQKLLPAALVCAAGSATAVDFGGYFRSGPGTSGEDSVDRACFQLPGTPWKYRLGNECDFYGEFFFGESFNKEGETPSSVHFTPAIWSPTGDGDRVDGTGSNRGTGNFGVAEMYGDIKVGDLTWWIGKRYLGRADVHILDYKYTVFDGTGAGVQGIDLGGPKLGIAFFRSDGGGTQPANRLNFDLTDITVNPGGKLRLAAALVKGAFAGGESGANFSVIHYQGGVFGGENALALQYAQGSAAINGTFGTLTAGADVKSYRILDTLYFQPTPKFGGQVVAIYQQDKANADDAKIMTLGGRVSYAITKNFKLLGELGFDRVKPDTTDARNLTKFTFAPTVTVGEGFWKRPELRFYVTTAKWNDAANAAGDVGGAAYVGKTSGTSYGAQIEVWF
jgi:maltoporin